MGPWPPYLFPITRRARCRVDPTCGTLALLLAIGCSAARHERPPGVLREILLADQHADLEVATIHLRDPEGTTMAEIWQSCDEQAVPHRSRRTLRENGLRAGVIGLVLPEPLRAELSSERGSDLPPLPEATADSRADIPWKFQRLRVRWGQRNEIIASGVRPQMTAFLRQEGRLSGKTFHQAQAILATRVDPTSDGAITLSLAPEVHYGDHKQRYVAGEGTFRLSASRDRFAPSQLAFDVPLSPGETLLLSASGPPGSFGRSFLDEKDTCRLLLIRLAATQHEPLYSPAPGPDASD